MNEAHTISQRILKGDRSALSRAITLCESRLSKHQAIAREILLELDQTERTALRIGITGPPGVGKSTFIEYLGLYLLEKDLKPAVLTIDPSSESSGGSILGDQTRMENLSKTGQAFIRQSPTSKQLGGIGPHTREAIFLCEKARYDVVLIETVGVGQSEYKVAELCDLMVVLVQPGSGDELQGVKRGIMEIGDLFVVTKADQGREQLAQATLRQIKNALHLMPTKHESIKRPSLSVSALESRGIHDFWEEVMKVKAAFESQNVIASIRSHQLESWFWDLLKVSWLNHLNQKPETKQLIEEHWTPKNLKEVYDVVDRIMG